MDITPAMQMRIRGFNTQGTARCKVLEPRSYADTLVSRESNTTCANTACCDPARAERRCAANALAIATPNELSWEGSRVCVRLRGGALPRGPNNTRLPDVACLKARRNALSPGKHTSPRKRGCREAGNSFAQLAWRSTPEQARPPAREKKKEQRPGCVTRAHQGRWLSKINPNYATRSDFILLNFPSGQKICRPRK
jgi:hypothetical protein